MCDDNFPQLVITDLGQNNLSDKLLLPLGLQSQCIFFCNISIPGQPSTAVESGNTWMRPRGQQLWQSAVAPATGWRDNAQLTPDQAVSYHSRCHSSRVLSFKAVRRKASVSWPFTDETAGAEASISCWGVFCSVESVNSLARLNCHFSPEGL